MADSHIVKELHTAKLPLSEELFYAIAAKVVLTPIETVILRNGKSGIEILLLKRPADDPFWPNQLHSPGTILQPTDTSYGDAFARIEKEELHTKFLQPPMFVTTEFRHLKRGAENAVIFIAELDGEPKVGTFYNYLDLPTNIIEGQLDMWAKAVAFYKQKNSR